MIIRSVCNSCFSTFVITLMPDDVSLVRQVVDEKGHSAPCPRLCGGRINMVGDPNIDQVSKLVQKDPTHITGKQLYQAINGAGLPDELPKDILTLVALLKAHKVEDVKMEEIHGRFYLHELTLENGVTLHLSGGPRGAQVLKVTKPPRRTDARPTPTG
jgi:hypothetical protein